MVDVSTKVKLGIHEETQVTHERLRVNGCGNTIDDEEDGAASQRFVYLHHFNANSLI